MEQDWLLGDIGDILTETSLGYLANILAVNCNRATIDIGQSEHDSCHRCLARAAASNDTDSLSARYREAEAVKDLLALTVVVSK